MEWLLESGAYKAIAEYIAPQMLIIVVVLLVLGWIAKNTPSVKDWIIPYILLLLGCTFGVLIVKDVTEGVIQGVIVTGTAILINNLHKQYIKRKEVDSNET